MVKPQKPIEEMLQDLNKTVIKLAKGYGKLATIVKETNQALEKCSKALAEHLKKEENRREENAKNM